jgi:hypothetical protein
MKAMLKRFKKSCLIAFVRSGDKIHMSSYNNLKNFIIASDSQFTVSQRVQITEIIEVVKFQRRAITV